MSNHQSQIATLALQRSRYKHLSDEEWRWFLQQVEGRERTADKLPTFASIEDWWYPVRLSCEQCSSELTARYKAQIVHRTSSNRTCLDLTAGYGVDTYFLSEQFEHTDYVEQNPELCRIASHNFSLIDNRKSIIVHNTTAEDFLNQIVHRTSLLRTSEYDLIFLDPARRDSHGGKVFRLEDCTPNVVELLPSLLEHLTPEGRILLKLSPMLDLTQALKALSFVHRTSSPCTLTWDIHIVAIKNEVKEILLLSQSQSQCQCQSQQPSITCIDLAELEKSFVFTRDEEQNAPNQIVHRTSSPCTFLYEPSASILKAGAYKLVAQRFGLTKLDVNTHLYASDTLIPNFPGRVWEIKEIENQQSKIKNLKSKIENANVLTRNYPLTPEQLKKKLHLRDGGTAFVIGCRVAGKPTLLYAERVYSTSM